MSTRISSQGFQQEGPTAMSDNQSVRTDDDHYTVGRREIRSRVRAKSIVTLPTELRAYHRLSEAPSKGSDRVGSAIRKTIGSKFISASVTCYSSMGKSVLVNPKETAASSLPSFRKETDVLPEYLQEDRLRNAFDWLHAQWDRDIYFDSSATNAVNHPAYQVIIALGPSMIPLIVDKVRNGENHWSKALRILTGSHPSAKDRLNSETLREYWVNWAEEHKDKSSLY